MFKGGERAVVNIEHDSVETMERLGWTIPED